MNPDSPMLDFADIARAEERRCAQGLAEIADACEPIAGGIMARGPKRSWANNAVGLGMHGPVTRADIDRLTHWFTSHGIEPHVEAAAHADESLLKHLADAGYRATFFETVLYRQLDSARVQPMHPAPPDIEIEVLDRTNEAQVLEHAACAVAGFMPEGKPPSDEGIQVASRTLRHARVVGVGARIAGRLVGAGSMEVSGDIAALFGLSVLPDFRRRGIQQSLMAERLNIAYAKGARLATIGSKPGIPTERNCRRMGFAIAYAKIHLVLPGEGLVGPEQ